VRAFERELIPSRLERYGGNVKAARESLGLTKTTFDRIMKRLAITPVAVSPEE
jgi:DNA-binding NtrC family response regulator